VRGQRRQPVRERSKESIKKKRGNRRKGERGRKREISAICEIDS